MSLTKQDLFDLEERIASRLGTMIRELEGRVNGRFQGIDGRFKDLEERLDERFQGIDARFQDLEERMDKRIQGAEDRMASLLGAEVGSLHTEIGALRVHMDDRLMRIDERLDHQGLMLGTGTKALGGLLEHMTVVDSSYSRMEREVSELRNRIERLEKAS